MRGLLIVASCALLPLALAAPPDGSQPDAALLEGDAFRAGASVVLAEPVTGDALLAGGTVESNASVGGDAALAGGQVAVRATVGDDLYAAGGDVEIDALVAGNARIAGGRVVIAPESRLDGGVAIAGGTVDARGRFGRYLTVAGGDVTLGGTIDGDVRVYARDLTVLPGTRIAGELSYRTAVPPRLPPDLAAGGGVREGPAAGDDRDARRAADGVGWLAVAGLFALGLLLVVLPAGFTRRTSAVLAARPWVALAAGMVILAGLPAAAVVLLFTLVGIPLAMVLLAGWLAMLPAGYVVGALFLGDRGLAAAGRSGDVALPARLGAFLLALVLLALLGTLPVLGSLARLAVLLLGLGGLVLALRPGPVSSR